MIRTASGRAHVSITLPWLFAAAVAGGCVGEVAHERDSSDDPRMPMWPVDPSPSLVLPSDGPESPTPFEIELPVAGLLLSDAVAIADGLAPAVHVFDRSGTLLRSVGRRGDGPSEFQSISWLGACGGDSVYAWDFVRQRMAVVDAAGSVARTFRMPNRPDAGAPPAAVACSRRGQFAYLARPDLVAQARDDAIVPILADLFVANSDGSVERIRSGIALAEFVVRIGQYRPLGRQTHIALAPDRIYVGTADSAMVDAFDYSGLHVASIAVWSNSRTPTRRHLEEAVREHTQWVAEAGIRKRIGDLLMAQPLPESLPPYTDLFVDPLGDLWVLLTVPGDSTTNLRVIAPDGRVRGDVLVPTAMRVFDIGESEILGSAPDSAGAPRVVLYRFQRGRQP